MATAGMQAPAPRSIWATGDSSHHRQAGKIVCIKAETPILQMNENKVKKTYAKGREDSCDIYNKSLIASFRRRCARKP